MRYRSRRPDDAVLRARMRDLAAQRRRFGYRRLRILLDREGTRMNHKKLRRLYREERLQVRRRGGRKRALGIRAPLSVPQGPNQRWSLDFLSDQLTNSWRFRVLAIVDDFTRECRPRRQAGWGVARDERSGSGLGLGHENEKQGRVHDVVGTAGKWLHSQGMCNGTDADGGKAFLVFSCAGNDKGTENDCWGRLTYVSGKNQGKVATASWHDKQNADGKGGTAVGAGNMN